MEQLKKRILKDGKVLSGNILKVGSFLNQQIDVELLDEMASVFVSLFSNERITKILTVESSGIAVSCSVARLLHVPVLFCKKNKSANVSGEVFSTTIHSYTHGTDFTAIVPKEFISKDDSFLIIDDFLANGCAVKGMVDLIKQAGASCVGAGIVIEKGFQLGGKELRDSGFHLESLAIIDEMSPEKGITFRN